MNDQKETNAELGADPQGRLEELVGTNLAQLLDAMLFRAASGADVLVPPGTAGRRLTFEERKALVNAFNAIAGVVRCHCWAECDNDQK